MEEGAKATTAAATGRAGEEEQEQQRFLYPSSTIASAAAFAAAAELNRAAAEAASSSQQRCRLVASSSEPRALEEEILPLAEAARPLPSAPAAATATGLAPLLAHWARVTGATSPRDTSALAERLWRRVRDRVCVATLAAAGAAAPLPAALAACVWVASKALDARAAVPPAAALLALAGGARCDDGGEEGRGEERGTAATCAPSSGAGASFAAAPPTSTSSNLSSQCRRQGNSSSFRSSRPCTVMATAELHVLALLDWKPLDGWAIGGSVDVVEVVEACCA